MPDMMALLPTRDSFCRVTVLADAIVSLFYATIDAAICCRCQPRHAATILARHYTLRHYDDIITPLMLARARLSRC